MSKATRSPRSNSRAGTTGNRLMYHELAHSQGRDWAAGNRQNYPIHKMGETFSNQYSITVHSSKP